VEIKCQLDATDVFYCRSYCLLNMFRAPLCPSSGAREYYTFGCRLWSLVLGFQVVGMVWSWGLCPVCGLQQPENRTHNSQLHTIVNKTNQLYNTLELLMMGIMVPETCWASNKICNKKTSVASSWHFISTLTTMHGQNHLKLCNSFGGGGVRGGIIVKFSHVALSLGSHTSETIRLVWSVNRFSDLHAVTFGALL
jgi:hypothetical protein